MNSIYFTNISNTIINIIYMNYLIYLSFFIVNRPKSVYLSNERCARWPRSIHFHSINNKISINLNDNHAEIISLKYNQISEYYNKYIIKLMLFIT